MEPIVLEFDVECSPEHAFQMWTLRTALWWPNSHTMTGDSACDIVFGPRVGGRIFERGPEGTEHEWGEIQVWEPPMRIGYRWHLFFDRSEATDVEVSFQPTASGTRVRLVQTGFDRLSEDVALTGETAPRAHGARSRATFAMLWSDTSQFRGSSGRVLSSRPEELRCRPMGRGSSSRGSLNADAIRTALHLAALHREGGSIAPCDSGCRYSCLVCSRDR